MPEFDDLEPSRSEADTGRALRIRALRRRIERGDYDTDAKLREAIARLLADLSGKRP